MPVMGVLAGLLAALSLFALVGWRRGGHHWWLDPAGWCGPYASLPITGEGVPDGVGGAGRRVLVVLAAASFADHF